MTHRNAVALMILCCFLWSIAGIGTRQLESAQSFEVSFWRSTFAALSLLIALSVMRRRALWVTLRTAGLPLWFSGCCWAIMYTSYMVAMTKTTVANVLITLAVSPLLTALFAQIFLKHALPLRTWIAIVIAGGGITWMFWEEAALGISLTGTLIAMGVPLASSANLTLLQYLAARRHREEKPIDMLPAILIGATLSALVTFPFSWPFEATLFDRSLLGTLGLVQLAIPCLLMVRLTRELPAAELSLINLLEVLFGITWVWLFANEVPSTATLTGGMLVLGALIFNNLMKFKKPAE